MSQKNQFAVRGGCRNSFPKRNLGYLLFMFVLITHCIMMQSPLLAQEQDSLKFTINLKSRKFMPQMGIKKNTRTKLKTSILQEKKIPHIMIQFKDTPSREEREFLKMRGVKLLSYIGGNAWYAALSDTSALLFMDSRITAKYPTLGLIRWVGEILPQDKIDTKIAEVGIGSYAINPDGTVNIIVQFFKDIPREQASAILEKYGSNVQGPGMLNDWRVTLNENNINKLAAEDEVQYIEEVSPPEKDHNDGSRNCANINAVQAAPYNLDGDNVQVGEWDGGEIGLHTDLAGRLTIVETGTISDHATHVAGTLAGDGSESAGSGGTANQWRGVATEAELFSYTYLVDNLEPEDHNGAINDNDKEIDISQNSWGLVLDFNDPLYGNYRLRTVKYDSIVTGVYGRRIPIVFSAGNDQQRIINPNPPFNVIGYGSITPPGGTAKNVITVGAVNSNDNTMTNFSSWGPTDDGRIKPDLVAPGGETGAAGIVSIIAENHDQDVFNNATGDYIPATGDGIDDFFFPYSNDNAGANEPEPAGTNAAPEDVWEGTSMAAPVVSGTIALMLQQYRENFFGSDNVDDAPLPSTFKALLIHSAQDLFPPGPDFQFGYGLINAQAAVDLIRDTLMLESQFAEDDEEDIFLCDVPAGQPRFNVTLVWDDAPGNAGAIPALVNDLDLELEDPNGIIHEPWILDPANPANNALTGADHTNNVEQVHVNNPAAGLWRIKVIGSDINEPIQKYSLVYDFPLYLEDNISVVQVIDRTGSMRHRDDPSYPTYMECAKTAAQNFIGLMQLGDEVGVVAFDKYGSYPLAEDIFNLTEITNETVRNNAITSIDPLDDRGATSIGAGIQLAQDSPNFLDAAAPDQPHAMVLLTDGYENNPPWVRERPADYYYKSATPDNILETIPDETDIYTIALGSAVDDELMRDIANTTSGKFYESPTILGLLSIYYQIQGDLELGDMAGLSTGTKSSGNDTLYVTVDYGTGEATFTIGWLQKEGRLKLTLKDPLGGTITSSSPNVKTGNGPTYYYLRIKNPLPGDWEVHIIRTDSAAFEIDYTFAAFVKGVSKLWSFIPYFTFADDCLLTKVHLYDSRTLQPITGASVEALIVSPHTSKYTLHYNYVKPGVSGWQPKAVMSSKLIRPHSVSVDTVYEQLPKWVTTLQFYNQQSLKETGQSIFQYDTTEVILYDDGTHGDEEVEDGNYTNCIDESKVAGPHSITFSISGVDQSGSNFTRKLVSTASIMPGKVDPVKTLVRVDPSRIDVAEGSEATITIVPLDGFGNVWGPGYASRISVSTTAGTLVGDIKDNGDGFYFQTISSTGTQGIGKVTVVVDDVEMRSNPSLMIGLGYRFSVSIHSGTAFPTGTFATDFDPGFNVLLDVDYHFSPQFSLVGFFGYNAFESKITGIDATYWINLSANVRYQRLLTIPFSYYIGAGPGIYIPKDGDTEFGVNAGCGFNYELNPRIAFELGADYHMIFDADIQFVHSHVGVIFRF